MGFANPISVDVPILTKDLLVWPCISGETFPPVFVNTVVYSARFGVPTVRIECSGVTSSATWPAIPRTGPTTAAQVLRITLNALVTTGVGVPLIITYGNPASNWRVRLQLRTSGVNDLEVVSSAGSVNNTWPVDNSKLNKFCEYVIKLDTAGIVTVYAGGVQVQQVTTRLWLPNDDAAVVQLKAEASNGAAGNYHHIAKLSAAWAAA